MDLHHNIHVHSRKHVPADDKPTVRVHTADRSMERRRILRILHGVLRMDLRRAYHKLDDQKKQTEKGVKKYGK